MKRILIVLLIIPSLSFAQGWGGTSGTGGDAIDSIYVENDSLKYDKGDNTYGFPYVTTPASGASGNMANDYNNIVSETINSDQDDRAILTGTGARFNVTSNLDFTGMAGGTHGDIFLIFNVGSNEIVFKNNNNASTIGNRVFTFGGGGDKKLKRNGSVYIRYDSALANGNGGWHLIEMQH